ncbi:hypothetical protein [Klebsiella phage vB_KvaP_F5M1D]|nr:hypothetical protein [Klebsiella phage vB_KvaP_F5M1D]
MHYAMHYIRQEIALWYSTMVSLGIHNMQVIHKVLHYGMPRYTSVHPLGYPREQEDRYPAHAHLSTGYPQPAIDLPTGHPSYPQHAL